MLTPKNGRQTLRKKNDTLSSRFLDAQSYFNLLLRIGSLMPPVLLPIFPSGISHIISLLAQKKDGLVTYFNGAMPIFRHPVDDDRSFRMITSQFRVDGYAKQVDIVGAFGVSTISVKRRVKTYRELGPSGFFLPRRTRGPTVLTTNIPTSAQQQECFNQGLSQEQRSDHQCSGFGSITP